MIKDYILLIVTHWLPNKLILVTVKILIAAFIALNIMEEVGAKSFMMNTSNRTKRMNNLHKRNHILLIMLVVTYFIYQSFK